MTYRHLRTAFDTKDEDRQNRKATQAAAEAVKEAEGTVTVLSQPRETMLRHCNQGGETSDSRKDKQVKWAS